MFPHILAGNFFRGDTKKISIMQAGIADEKPACKQNTDSEDQSRASENQPAFIRNLRIGQNRKDAEHCPHQQPSVDRVIGQQTDGEPDR